MRRLVPLIAVLLLATMMSSGHITLVWEEGSASSRASVYHTSYEMAASLRELSLSHPMIAEYSTASELFGVREVPGGRQVPILFLGDKDEARPWVMLVGAHHGDEPDSAEALLGFARYMVDSYDGGDRRVKDILEDVNVAVLPVVNPYGLDVGSRYDENGEDPNRDYPFAAADAGPHSDGTPLTTAGAMTVHRLASRYPFSVVLSFHAGSEGIYTPWGAPGFTNITPDGNCFMDMAYVLKRASGRSLPYGPANDFGYLGNLNGALEDHLYGSMFLRDRLFEPEMSLPWSSFTATVELLNRKGQDPMMLGSLEGVMDPGGPNDGTLPMGVRISLAACMMASPSIRGSMVEGGMERTLELSLSGMLAAEPSFEPAPASVVRTGGHPFLPEVRYTAVWKGESEGKIWYNVSIGPDPSWPNAHPDAEPAIAPVSLLSLSRGVRGYPRGLSTSFLVGGTVGPSPLPPTVTASEVRPELPVVGSKASIELTIVPNDASISGLTINASCGGTWARTELGAADVIIGTSWYPFELPFAAGLTRIDLTLRTDIGDATDVGMVLTEPSIYIMSLLTSRDNPDRVKVLVGMDGSSGPVVMTYGIVRYHEGTFDWVRGPFYHLYSTADSSFIEMDLSGLGGDVSFVVGRADATITDSREHHLDRDVRIIGATISRVGSSIVLGPALIVQDANGPTPVHGYDNIVNFEVEMSIDGRTYHTGEMSFVLREDLSPEMSEALSELALDNGLDPDKVFGCYLGYAPVPESPSEVIARFQALGTLHTPQGSPPMDFRTDASESGPLFIEVEEQDGKRPFPWSILVFISLTAVVVMIVTALRYDAHWREPQPDPGDLPVRVVERPRKPDPERRGGGAADRPRGPRHQRARPFHGTNRGGGPK